VNRYAIIMAGGSGERFYPLSRQQRPKQLLPLLGNGKLLIEHAVERCLRVLPPENTFVITSLSLQEPIRDALQDYVPGENIIAEPAKRNTAGCLTLAAALVGIRDEEATIAALPADHFIGDLDAFASSLSEAFAFTESHALIVTFGIVPTRPETGFGYIELGEPLGSGFYRVRSFREKPDRATAERFLASGQFRWNSGMFVYRLRLFEQQLLQHAPAFGSAIAPLRQAIEQGNSNMLSSIFGQLPNVSIDYALMERTPDIAVLNAPFDWDDLGSWDALPRIISPDKRGTLTVGTTVAIDCTGTTLANYADSSRLLCALGLQDIVAVVTDDVVLLCRQDNVQQVRQVVEYLRAHGMERWL
jgi:mannose-1-phosphate guanylyltransferase